MSLSKRQSVSSFTDDRQGPDFLLDTAVIQQRMTARQQTPNRVVIGRFICPSDASRQVRENIGKESIGLWINRRQKQGWELVSAVTVQKLPHAVDDTGAVLLGVDGYECKAVFRMVRSVEQTRVELNPATVKQDPEHRLSLHEAIKAWNVQLPRNGR